MYACMYVYMVRHVQVCMQVYVYVVYIRKIYAIDMSMYKCMYVCMNVECHVCDMHVYSVCVRVNAFLWYLCM
jgi:hypothetical protein